MEIIYEQFSLTFSGYKCKLYLQVTFVTCKAGCQYNQRGGLCNPKGGADVSKLVSRITDSELEVMRVLWQADGELSLAGIRKTLEQTSNWETSTIKTLLRRLCNKGVVAAAKKEVYYYKPLVSEGEYTEYTTQSLIDRLYSGSAKNLVASLLGSKKLDDKEIEELRTLFKVGDDRDE